MSNVSDPASVMLSRLDGPSPAQEVALDIVRRGIWIAPVAVTIGGFIWGMDGVASVAYGLLLILANFWLSALLIGWASRISLALVMGVTLFGFLIRLGLIFIAVYLVKDASWINFIALGVTIIVSHLGLLFWELRYVSGSLAYPGLKPTAGSTASAPSPTRPDPS